MENDTQPSPMAPQTKKSSTKKIVLIVVGVIVVLMIVGGVGLFAVGKKVVNELSEKGVDIKKDSVSVKNDDGSTTTFGKAEIPADWPTDLPQYPGSTVAYTGTNTATDGKVATAIVLSTSDSPDTVSAYYKKELVAKGWKNIASNNASGTITLAFEKDTRQAVVITGASEDKTAIALSVTSK